MRASPVRGAAGLSSGEGQKQVSELFCCLRGTSRSFFLLKTALHSLAKGAHFCRLKMGRCFLNTTVLFMPRWLQSCLRGCCLPPSLLSSLWWRPCSPPGSGTAVTGHKEMPEMLYNQSCLATAASEPPRGSAPFTSVLEVGVSVQQAAAVSLGGIHEWGTSDLIADTNSLQDLWQGFALANQFT